MLNQDTDKLVTFTFTNEPAYFEEALQKIKKVTKEQHVIFGLEDIYSFGLHFSYYLTNRNYDVKLVDPALASAYRKTLPNYHKSDEFDSLCVAKVLKDEYKRLPSFQHEVTHSNIKLVVNMREQVVKHQSANYIILHQQLMKVFPGYRKFFSTLKKRSALAFFKVFPSPRHLKGYSAEALSKEMRLHTTEFPVTRSKKILSIVRSNLIPFHDPIVEGVIVDIITDIYHKEERIASLEKQLEELIQITGYQLHSIPSVGIVTAAKLIAEIGNIHRFSNQRQLAKFAGISPTSVGSGGKNKELVSRGGNRELRATFFYLAVGMILVTRYGNSRNEVIRQYYLKKLSEGKTKTQALVCVMRKLVKIVYSLMKSQKEYVAHVETREEKVIETVDS